MAQRMQILGLEVATTTSPWEALDRVERESFDAVIIDLMMPEMYGLDFLKAVKRRVPNLLVILLTGHATVSMSLAAAELGAFELIEKPADLKALAEKIKRAKVSKKDRSSK